MAEEMIGARILRVTDDESIESDDVVVREFPLTITLNNEELATMLCSPSSLEFLALGFLASEGLIQSREDVGQVQLNESRGTVRVETVDKPSLETDMVFKRFITSGCGKGTMLYSFADAMNRKKVESQLEVSPAQVFSLMKGFQSRSEVFRQTGGVHSAALADGENIIVFSEDIGRHNAVDKVFGQCLWEGISTRDRILLTSGRVSSEILFKIAKREVPVIISRSAPTDLAIKTASELGITLVGFVRGKRMNVYTGDGRIQGIT